MIAGAWICLAAPLAGAIAITLAGRRISRRTAGWLSTLSVFVAFAGAVWAFFGLRSNGSEDAWTATAWTWLQSGSFKVGLTIIIDPLSTMMMLIVSGVGGLIVLYSIGYMDGDDEERRYFAYMSFFVFSMLLARPGRQPAAAPRRLGPRRPQLLPADRLLARAADRGRGREEGVRDERDRRRDDGAVLLRADPAHPLALVRLRVQRPPLVDHSDARRARPARRRRGEVRADPAPHLAARTRWKARRRSPP